MSQEALSSLNGAIKWRYIYSTTLKIESSLNSKILKDCFLSGPASATEIDADRQ